MAPAPTHLHIHPAETPLVPASVTTHARRLHSHLANAVEPRFRHRLTGTPPPPAIEALLVSDGADSPVDYYLGSPDPDHLAALDRLARGLFPDSYEIDRVTAPLDPVDADNTAAVELRTRLKKRLDWQTRLTTFEDLHERSEGRVPLAAVVEAMAATEGPMLYQALLRPFEDFSDRATLRAHLLADGFDLTWGDSLTQALGLREPHDAGPAYAERVAELEAKDARNAFCLNARAVAFGPDADRAIADVASAFASVSRTSTTVEARRSTGRRARRVYEDCLDRALHGPTYERTRTRLPGVTPRSRGIVADAAEVGSFLCLDGAGLPTTAQRAVAPTPGERTALPRPPLHQLERYQDEPGMPLGDPLTADGTRVGPPVTLAPGLQSTHVGLFGKTGTGKSTAHSNLILGNHASTPGLSLVIDTKGDGWPAEYLEQHYARFGTLDDVRYFDCAELLPALAFFDIRERYDTPEERTDAVEKKVDHYVELLKGIMGADRFERAIRSPDIIQYLVKALFDEVHGDDAYTHRDLQEAVRTLHERQTAPVVSDPDLEELLAGVASSQARSFEEIMQGVANRIEKVPLDRRLARVFNHVPGADDPHFDVGEWLNRDVVVLLDMGGLRPEAQRVLTLVVLSDLWTALKRRGGDGPVVNLHLEEAADVATTGLVGDLLSKGRGFNLSVTLSMQFPGQLRHADQRAYEEVLNEIGTFVVGNVPVDDQLTRRLAHDDMAPQAVSNRVRALERGQWLLKLAAPYGAAEPRPFVAGSLPLPPGHPEGEAPLEGAQQRAFEQARIDMQARTRAAAGLRLDSPSTVDDEADDGTTTEDGAETGDGTTGPAPIKSALELTKRMPSCIAYDAESHALTCERCGDRYDPSSEGIRQAIECCHTLDRVDHDDIPIVDLNLKLTPAERGASKWSDAQLCFLQAVYNAQQQRYAQWEYDLLHDSMLRLQEYVGIESDAVTELIDAGLLSKDCDRPHRLYTVTAEGRATIQESHHHGQAFGDGKGDLGESSQHVLAVEVGRRYVQQRYADDPDSPVVEVVAYHPVSDDDEEEDTKRLDVAGLDADGDVVVTLEAERVNHDVREAVPADFDKMASCEPEAAIWITMSQGDAHEVLDALNDPLDGEPRVEKTYSEKSPPQKFRIDTPGCTAMFTVEHLLDRLGTDALP